MEVAWWRRPHSSAVGSGDSGGGAAAAAAAAGGGPAVSRKCSGRRVVKVIDRFAESGLRGIGGWRVGRLALTLTSHMKLP